jgi:hypothetical protein
MLQVFYLFVAKVDWDVACICNGFQVFCKCFRHMLQVFQLLQTVFHLDVAHVALGPPAAVARLLQLLGRC